MNATSSDPPVVAITGAEGTLLVQRCRECGLHQAPARLLCDACGADAPAWTRATGLAVVHTYVVMHHAYLRGTPVPYAVALIELDEGPRLLARADDVPLQDLRVGMRVRAGPAQGGVLALTAV